MVEFGYWQFLNIQFWAASALFPYKLMQHSHKLMQNKHKQLQYMPQISCCSTCICLCSTSISHYRINIEANWSSLEIISISWAWHSSATACPSTFLTSLKFCSIIFVGLSGVCALPSVVAAEQSVHYFLPEGVVMGLWNFAWSFKSQKK